VKPIDRIALLVLATVFVFGVVAIRNLDQDDGLIDRGQQVQNCIGFRADLIDDWRAVFLGYQTLQDEEFLVQVERVQEGLPVVTDRAEQLTQLANAAERNIRLLVQSKRELRRESNELIAEGDTDFDCPPVDPDLEPPPIPDP